MWHQVWKYKSSATSHGFLNCPDKANNHRLRKLLNLQIFNSFNSHSSVYPLSDILTHDTVRAQHNLPHSTDHKLTPRLRSSPDLFQINGSSMGFPILITQSSEGHRRGQQTRRGRWGCGGWRWWRSCWRWAPGEVRDLRSYIIQTIRMRAEFWDIDVASTISLIRSLLIRADQAKVT